MLNRVILIGRLTRDPELKYTPNGTAVTRFSVAVNRKYKREETDFIDVVVWGQPAEFVANYGGKGRLVMVEGRLQVRAYETQDGQKRKATEGNRTLDPSLTKRLLYRLSYGGIF